MLRWGLIVLYSNRLRWEKMIGVFLRLVAM
ncbi:UNVERIFIED_CONTAM: hypothetical protein GTU68_062426 [Idotea baltica]|nr:hypothetical protein [Idotea baltica]